MCVCDTLKSRLYDLLKEKDYVSLKQVLGVHMPQKLIIECLLLSSTKISRLECF